MTRWRRAAGRAGGTEYADVDGLTVVRRRGSTSYQVHVRRGKGPLVDDWGPFETVEGDDPYAVGREWVATMAAKGWFEADLAEWNAERTAAAVARLPRSTVIPTYFLKTADEVQVARGRAFGRKVLRVGGIDVHDREEGRRERWAARRRARIVFSRPGAGSRAPDSLACDLDRASLDALIERLLVVRSTLVGDGAATAMDAYVLAGPRPEDAEEAVVRVRGMARKRERTDRIMERIMAMQDCQMAMVDVLLDRIEGLFLPPDLEERAPDGLLN